MERKMATHFARGILTEGHLILFVSPPSVIKKPETFPLIVKPFSGVQRFTRRTDVHAVWHGELPEIVTLPKGKPVFSDKICLRFLFPMPGIWSAWR